MEYAVKYSAEMCIKPGGKGEQKLLRLLEVAKNVLEAAKLPEIKYCEPY